MKAVRTTYRGVNHLVRSDLFRFVGYTSLVCMYLACGALFYALYEGWTGTETLFFLVTTISTVGYGNPAPSDDSSRLFTVFFIIFGIFVLFAGIHDFIYNNLGLLRNHLCKSTTRQVSEDLAAGDVFHYRKRLVRYMISITLLVLLGAIVIKFNEELSWISAFYFIVETASTVGYGDIALRKPSSKQFMTVFIVVSTTMIALAIRTYSAVLEENRQLEEAERRLRRLQGLRFLRSMRPGAEAVPTQMTKSELLLMLLTQEGVISRTKNIEPWLQKIDAADVNHHGVFSSEDLQRFLEAEADDAALQFEQLQTMKRLTVWSFFTQLLTRRHFTVTEEATIERQYSGIELFPVEDAELGSGRGSGASARRSSEEVVEETRSPLSPSGKEEQ